MNNIAMKKYIYPLILMTIFMQGCESGEATPSVSDEEINEAVTEISSYQLMKGSVTEDKLADQAVTEDKLADQAVTENKIKDDAVTADKLAVGAVTADKLVESLSNKINDIANKLDKTSNAVPAGVIMAWPGDSSKIPNGWAHANGEEINCTNYAELCSALNGAWGSTDTNDYLPDLRGVVLRGLDANKTVDPDCDNRNEGVIEYRSGDDSRLIFANSNGVYVDVDVDADKNLGIDSGTIKEVTLNDDGTIASYGDGNNDYSVYGTTGCNVGSYQADATAAPRNPNASIIMDEGSNKDGQDGTATDSDPTVKTSDTPRSGVQFVNFDNETRMKNAAVHYIISCGNDYTEPNNKICDRQ